MTQAIAVIGTNYGDEGKGLATDYFTRRHGAPLVVRGNGGTQAGHTVVDGEKRHVFGHITSGAFAGARSYLGSQFIVNPVAFESEHTEVPGATVWANGDCRVSTIYDMAMNSLVELARDADRHGSCGYGINETVTRHAAGFRLDFQTLKYSNFEQVRTIIDKIKHEWVPRRMAEHGVGHQVFRNYPDKARQRAEEFLHILSLPAGLVAKELILKSGNLYLSNPRDLCDQGDTIVYEGAQGLMLDEFLGEFPHVTRSITGLPSAVRAVSECGATEITPVYMTRSYATRHGAGTLRFEGSHITDADLVDLTNVDNDWQGSIRYAPLDLLSMKYFIEQDMGRGEIAGQIFSVKVNDPMLFITCMDQLGDTVRVADARGRLREVDTDKLVEFIEFELEIKVCATSHGPQAKDVREIVPVL